MSLLPISINSPNRNTPSSSTSPSFQIRQPSLKGKEKDIETVIDIQPINSPQIQLSSLQEKNKQPEIQPENSDVVIDIPSSSSQKNDFHEGVQHFINAFKNLKGTHIEETDAMNALKTEHAQNRKHIFTGIKWAVPTTMMTSGNIAALILFQNNELRRTLICLEMLLVPLTSYFLNNIRKNYSKNKKIREKMKDLHSLPPQVTRKQINETYMEQLNSFIVSDDDDKEFIDSFEDDEMLFLANAAKIMQEHSKENSHLVLKDNILTLVNKTEITKEDFLDIIAQHTTKMVKPISTDPRNSFINKFLEKAQGYLKKETNQTLKK